MPTLAELRANRPVRRAERARTICTAPDLVAEVMVLSAELEDLAVSPRPSSADGEDGPPRKMGQPAEDPRVLEIRALIAEHLAEMAKSEGELRIRAVEDGEWRRWVSEHPARTKDEDPSGYTQDLEVTRGFCNADDLIADLGRWAYSWDGEPLAEGDWEILAETIARPDKKQLARDVVGMHEQMGSDLPKWRADLSATLGRFPAAAQPAQPADPLPSTSAASLPSDTSTTTPTTS